MIDEATIDRLREAARAALAGRPPAHDALHVARVERLARAIAASEGARVDVVAAAAVLHELVNLPKDHPDSARSGDLCAEAASRVLDAHGVERGDRDAVVACIRDHAFSKGARPTTLEVAVLQDADRLDAIGAIGVARAFATCSEMGRPFYSEDDPFCRAREPDDKAFGLDHFFRKLLRIEERLTTATARRIAGPRTAFLRAFLGALDGEITGAGSGSGTGLG